MRNRRHPELIGAVLDSSVIVAAHLSDSGTSAELLRLWREEHAYQIITSDDILAELTRVLLERNVPEEIVEDFVTALHLQALLTDGLYVVDLIKADPSDNMFLAAALEGQADYIVSLDNHLLRLGSYHRVEIVRPALFLRRLRER